LPGSDAVAFAALGLPDNDLLNGRFVHRGHVVLPWLQRDRGADRGPVTGAVGQNKYINWPKLGYQAEDKVVRDRIDADWEAGQAFVPSGCTRVSNDGTTVNKTRCQSGELELIVFLYRWPAGYLEDEQTKKRVLVCQSDFHVVGRSAGSLPSGWHSKMDRRERV